MGRRGRWLEVRGVIASQQYVLATAFGRIWAAFVMEDHIAAQRQASAKFPGRAYEARLLASELTDDPTIREEMARLIGQQAEKSWTAMTQRSAAIDARTYSEP